MERKRQLNPDWELFYCTAEKGKINGPEDMLKAAWELEERVRERCGIKVCAYLNYFGAGTIEKGKPLEQSNKSLGKVVRTCIHCVSCDFWTFRKFCNLSENALNYL